MGCAVKGRWLHKDDSKGGQDENSWDLPGGCRTRSGGLVWEFVLVTRAQFVGDLTRQTHTALRTFSRTSRTYQTLPRFFQQFVHAVEQYSSWSDATHRLCNLVWSWQLHVKIFTTSMDISSRWIDRSRMEHCEGREGAS